MTKVGHVSDHVFDANLCSNLFAVCARLGLSDTATNGSGYGAGALIIHAVAVKRSALSVGLEHGSASLCSLSESPGPAERDRS